MEYDRVLLYAVATLVTDMPTPKTHGHFRKSSRIPTYLPELLGIYGFTGLQVLAQSRLWTYMDIEGGKS